MAGSRGDIAAAKQDPLINVGIELRLAGGIADIARPTREHGDGANGPIAVEDFKRQPARGEIARHLGERAGRGLRQQAARRLVTVDRAADKIVRAGITHIDDEARHQRGGVDELRRPLLRRRGLGADGHDHRDHQTANTKQQRAVTAAAPTATGHWLHGVMRAGIHFDGDVRQPDQAMQPFLIDRGRLRGLRHDGRDHGGMARAHLP